jgi:hypothetical protein
MRFLKRKSAEVHALRRDESQDFSAPLVGEIVRIDEAGCAHVSFPGSFGVAVPARSLVDAPARAGEAPEDSVGRPVLLVFEQADPHRPIIVGLLRAPLRPEAVRPELRLDLGQQRDVVVDGERLVFDARQEVLLRCGKSSLLLRPDGKVLIRGTHVVSRSSGPNRIKGGSISLN